MPEYRYHRMTDNRLGWRRPHTGRLGEGSGYVSEQGFGHEDWNFAKDVWDDGKYHLYLRMPPAKKEWDKTFNIVLGVHTKEGAMVTGFVENAEYAVSNLPDQIWQRRAEEVKALEEGGQLGPLYIGASVNKIKKMLTSDREIYNVSVATSDLIILEQPVYVPDKVYKVGTPQYWLLKMSAAEYAAVKEA